jgi:hypothetical protein
MSGDGRTVTWKDFAAAAPELAEAGRALLNQFGVGLAFLATVRRDGAPRLHPVCPVLSNERLFVLITPDSPKRGDLARDDRYAVGEDGRDLRAVLDLHPIRTPFCHSTTPSQRS